MAYHRIHRIGAWGPAGWWRALVGVLVVLGGLFVVVPFAALALFAVGFSLTGGDVVDRLRAVTDTGAVTPLGLVFLNLTLASGIALAWFASRVLHGLRPRWLASVAPRIRWGWFATCLGLALVALLATVAVSAFVPAQDGGADLAGGVNPFTSTTRDFLLVIVLLTPLQAAGEEYVFRGYLTQAFGAIVPSSRVGLVLAVLVPSMLFALAHGAQDAPTFVSRLAFGLVAGILTIATGGLEAGIAMHVLNNWLAFGLALAFTDMSSALNPTDGSWWNLPVTLTQSVVYTTLAIVVARRTGVATRTRPGSPRAVPAVAEAGLGGTPTRV